MKYIDIEEIIWFVILISIIVLLTFITIRLNDITDVINNDAIKCIDSEKVIDMY